MTVAAHLLPVSTDALFRYPIPVGVRLSSHGWFQFMHSWWRTSDFRRDADREVRAVWLDLLTGAQDEDPVGTLPVSDKDLAWVARIPLDDWMRLMSRPMTPIYGWKRCICSDDRIRLYHPKLLTITEDAARSKVDAADKLASDRERKRLKALEDRIVAAGGSQRLAADAAYRLRLDQYLTDNASGSRTVAVVRAAMEAMDLMTI